MNIQGIDDIDRTIIKLLVDDARLSYSEIGKKVGLSRVAVKNRIKAIENDLPAEKKIEEEWNSVRARGVVAENKFGRSVEPLVDLMWNQVYPYNYFCPTEQGGPGGHAFVGCAADVMAMIMKYWNYPEKGTGSHSYIPEGYPAQTVDFSSATYDWDNMPKEIFSFSPVNEIEERIVSAFEKVFDWENISVYDDFIRLGGDSLSAIKILSLLDDMDLSIKDILNLRIPYKIAQSIIRNQIIIEDYQYGFNLIKEGNKKRNMFLIPPIGGLSFTFSDLINSIDFDGNVYAIDDFKYDLSVDEIKNIDNNCSNLLDYYYNAIKDLFQDGDIIVGYSSGCIYASLLIEKLEKFKDVGECILIDGSLNFSSNVLPVREDVCKNVDDDFNKRILMSDMENYYLWNYNFLSFSTNPNLFKEKYDKIPKEYIEFLKSNCNNEYEFYYDNSKNFEEQEE